MEGCAGGHQDGYPAQSFSDLSSTRGTVKHVRTKRHPTGLFLKSVIFKESLQVKDIMSSNIHISPLGFPWKTRDPFLFCAHHRDEYPAGNAEMGPATSLAGRNLGQDFQIKDGWRMYHGQSIPGFPYHNHYNCEGRGCRSR